MKSIFLLFIIIVALISCSSIETSTENLESLTLEPSYKIENDSNIIFQLKAKRNKIVEREYFPNSEHFRVIITTLSGKIIWNSDYKQNFYQVIGDVAPTKVGEEYIYTLTWNGKDNQQNIIRPAEYKVRMVLPALPHSYNKLIDFKWK